MKTIYNEKGDRFVSQIFFINIIIGNLSQLKSVTVDLQDMIKEV